MNRIYEWIDRAWQWIAERIFVRFEFDLPVEHLRELSKSSKVVFALSHAGLVEYLILSSWCRSQGFGAISIVNSKRVLLFAHPKNFFQIIFRHKKISEMFRSADLNPRLLFCPTSERKKLFQPVPVERLLFDLYSFGASDGKPFHFVPLIIFWRKHVRGASRKLSEYLFGLSSNPNVIGKIWYLLRARKDSVVRALPDFPMLTATEGNDTLEESLAMRLAKTTRRKILVETQKEMRVVLGPRYSSPHSVKETLLRDPQIQEVIEEVARNEGIDRKKVMSRAYSYLTEIVSNYRYRSIEVAYVLLTWLFTRVFDGVSVLDKELQDVREIMRIKPVVFISCHRSHLDYLVIPYVLFLHDMVTPHIVAGVNLLFWPLGTFLRSGGGFFIRRSFRGNVLYSICLSKYLEFLLHNRYNVKFFIEGTRSRSGKMLAPAYGILKMVIQAQKNKCCEDIALVPVSISYDEVPEQGAYTKEIGGGQKTRESARELFRSRSVISKNIGKVYVRIAPPLYTKDIVLSESTERDSSLVLQKTAFQICKRINDVSPITVKSMVSSVLLANPFTSISLETILDFSKKLRSHAEWGGCSMSGTEENFSRSVEQTVRRLQTSSIITVNDATVPRTYNCDRRKRLVLNFYKNNGMHFFVIPSIAVWAFLQAVTEVEPTCPAQLLYESIRKRALELRNLLKFEFFFSPTTEFLTEVESHLGHVLKWDASSLSQSPLSLASSWIDVIHSKNKGLNFLSLYLRLSADLLESYATVLLYLKSDHKATIERKALVQRILKFAEGINYQAKLNFSESLSIQNYTNAIALLENLKQLTVFEDGNKKMVKVAAWTDVLEDRLTFIQSLLSLLNERPIELFIRRGFLASAQQD